MDNTDPYKTKFKEERLYMSTNQNLIDASRSGNNFNIGERRI